MHKFCKRRETQRIETKSCEMRAGKSVLKTWHSQIIYNTPGSVCRGCVVCVCVWCAWCVCYLLIKHESELSWAVLPVPGAFHQLKRTELNWAQNPQQTNKPMFSIAKQKSMYQPSPPLCHTPSLAMCWPKSKAEMHLEARWDSDSCAMRSIQHVA